MRKIDSAAVVFMAALLPVLVSWGTFGHEHINHAAVLALPSPIRGFFYNHIDFITQESTVPDLRKYTLNDKAERPKHFINLENFGAQDSWPQTYDELVTKYDEAFLTKNGILPWYLKVMMERLTRAFKEKRKTEILFLAADLGHYLADAHMPLHTTSNHDGELSGQNGIHAFWEAQLPDLFGNSYNLNVDAKFIGNIDSAIWNIMYSSHRLADTLLICEQQLKKNFKGKIYDEERSESVLKNKFGQPVHSLAYATEYHKLLNGMVEKQMRKAITATSGFWLTAWTNAGKPDLSSLDAKEITDENKLRLQKEMKLWQQGKLYGVNSEKEF